MLISRNGPSCLYSNRTSNIAVTGPHYFSGKNEKVRRKMINLTRSCFLGSAYGSQLRALMACHVYTLLPHDAGYLFLTENRIFLFYHINDAVTTDVKRYAVNVLHYLPAGFIFLKSRTLFGLFRVALHYFPTWPVHSQRHPILLFLN
jgi:hypothetical protein